MQKQIDATRPMLVTKDIQVHGYDIDVMGIVSNIVYVRWFEDLRMLFLDIHWPYTEMLKSQQSPILSGTTIEYLKPITIHDKPVGKLWMQEIAKARWTVGAEILVNNEVHCRGTQSGYFIDMNRNRIIRLPEKLVETFEQAKN